MAVTYGFFNSIDGDRKYDAEQLGSIFEGVIKDGVYKDVGDAFAVTATVGKVVQVGTGRGWFRNTWIKNDTPFSLTLSAPDSVLPRYDYIAIRSDRSAGGRKNSIVILKGSPATLPSAPTLTDTTTIKDYPIARIYRPGGAEGVTSGDISLLVGSTQTPWVTSVLESVSVSELFTQWEAEFNDWMLDRKSQESNAFYTWRNEQMSEFISWRNSVQAVLADDVAGSLTSEIEQLKAQITSIATENALYFELKDSDNNIITDSYGSSVMARQRYTIT